MIAEFSKYFIKIKRGIIMRWSLNELYTSFESTEFKSDMDKCNEYIQELIIWVKKELQSTEGAKEKIENYIKKQQEFGSIYIRLLSYAMLVSSVDAKNETALKVADQLQSKASNLTEATVQFEKWLGNIENIEEIIQSSPLLKEHQFYLEDIMLNNQYLLSEEEEILISKMSQTGAKAWTKLQQLLSSTLLVDITIDGEEKQLPLPVVRNMAYSADAATRKTAYEAELKSYLKIEESSAAALNGIKGESITISQKRGFASPLEQAVITSRMNKETLDAMLTAMKESLPFFHQYYRKKGELLGHNNGLPFYDMFAPIGNVDMEFTYEEAQKYIVDNFNTFSEELGDFAQKAFDKNWIDAEPRIGKRGGAFCSNLHPIKESRILANFDGSFSNMTTLAHELGHGYHGHCLKNASLLNSRYPMPLAETASIFAETIIINGALKTATVEEAFAILETSISDAGQVIVDIYSRFLFESEVFKRREDSSLSVNELKEIMISAQKEAYGNGLDHNVLHESMWINKSHYYMPERHFYNFPYAFGLLFSKGLYSEYLKRGEAFVNEYNNLLEATGKNNIVDVGKVMDIDVTSVDFWRSSLDLIKKDIEKFVDIADERLKNK